MSGPFKGTSDSRPSQIKFIRRGQMALFAKILCFPPLAQTTVIGRQQQHIEFTACLQSSKALPELPWEIAVWHNCPTSSSSDPSNWKTLPLVQSKNRPFYLIDASGQDFYQYIFSADVELGSDRRGSNGAVANFTIKFRAGPDAKWQWVKENFGSSDGTLVGCWPLEHGGTISWASSIFGDDYLQGWSISSLSSQSPGADLFKVESKDFIPRKTVDNAEYETQVFGSSNIGFCRYMALVRIWSPWLAPRHGEQRFNVTEDTLLCSFLTYDGRHLVLLPINGVHDTVTVFRSDDQGHVVVAARNDGVAEARFEFFAAIADSFESANAAVMYAARDVVVRTRSIEDDDFPTSPNPLWLEDWYDGLTYCTWNSLGQDLTSTKIFAALDDLAANEIHVSGLIIDDNWQSLDGLQGKTSQFQRGWKEFEANREGFPEGLKSTVTEVKSKYPAITNVAVWHGLHGYWGGLSPSGDIVKCYKTIEVEKQDSMAGGTMLAVDPSDIYRFYNDFYSFLSSCGITSVKTDVQFYLDLLAATPDRRAFATDYQSAWTIAHLQHFGGKAISCMSQIPQILFYSFLPTNRPRILLRNSDDFFPTIPASHPWHIFCNAHNALFVQHLNVLPDWDMFQTSHPYSGFHAAARCVSGGPIYVTDAPGEHDLDLVAQMTARNPRGQTVILRPSVIGRAIEIYDQYQAGHILKVGTYNGAAETGSGILGIFNVSDHPVSAMVPVTDFPGVTSATSTTADAKAGSNISNRFIIRSHVSNLISGPIIPSAPPRASNLILITLPVRGYDILTAYPVYDFPPQQEHEHQRQHDQPTPNPPHSVGPTPAPSTTIAILGLLGKMTGACAINSTTLDSINHDHNHHFSHNRNDNDRNTLRIRISLKALGTLGLWLSDLQRRTIDDDFLVTMHGQVVSRDRVWKEINPSSSDGAASDGAGVLAIDVQAAWKDLKFEGNTATTTNTTTTASGTSSNDIVVEVFVYTNS